MTQGCARFYKATLFPPMTTHRVPFVVGDECFETFVTLFGNLNSATDSPSHSTPTVVLHGGPGLSHDYLLPLADLAPSTGPIILYDQLGSGQSSSLVGRGAKFINIELFIRELENLLAFFNISSRYNLIGHSWGATLANEFIVRRGASGLHRYVLQNGLASAALRNNAIAALRKGLPEDIQMTLQTCEASGATDTQAYTDAMDIWYHRHSCRINPFPPELQRSFDARLNDPTVWDVIRSGPEQMGSGWDIRDKIHLMRHVPTLLINGEFDYMTDEVVKPFFFGIDKIKWVKFPESSHMPHIEERESYMSIVGDFLKD
ncbi:proline iminopeptidase [Cylindrobasidium torrendii FP15055 ss-10]|uniref:Proline iminopeptidase n=1 Tax=Cylindrobasidium torrendii FP15055 ss-10 TaxID=1314674 RepID=A0A0D7BMV3_9AGAR|nr:proline iminopeptidase [Cylindrobasidium torrendii FP15055 ss-10]